MRLLHKVSSDVDSKIVGNTGLTDAMADPDKLRQKIWNLNWNSNVEEWEICLHDKENTYIK